MVASPMSSGEAAPVDSSPSLAVLLAEVHVALALAKTEVDVVAAVARAFERYAPAQIHLAYMECDAQGQPVEAEVAAAWQDGAPRPDDPAIGRRFSLADFSLTAAWLEHPTEIFALEDAAGDPRVDPHLRALLTPHRGLAVLPLFSHSHSGWQGFLSLVWREPHALGDEERTVYRLLLQTVAVAIASRRTLRAHKAALDEASTLYAASARLNEAASLDDVLAVVGDLAGSFGANHAALETLVFDERERPVAIEFAACWGDPGVAAKLLGQRFAINVDDPEMRASMAGNFFVEDTSAAGLGPSWRALCEQLNQRASAVLPLQWRGRFLGFIAIGWTRTTRFTAGQRRLLIAIARQAAVVVDNRLLFEQTQRALGEQRRQRSTLETLLDNLPIGVYVEDAATRQPLLVNATAQSIGGEGPFDLTPPGSELALPYEEWMTSRTLATGEVVSGEVDVRRADGSRVGVDILSAPIRDESGAVVRTITVFQDISERRAAEQEHLRMREDLIRAQAAALAERSTPLIPISAEVLVMPLIGTIDEDRGRQILETLVSLGGHARVRLAIVDVTGVRNLGAQAAGAIIDAAKALRLRGVDAVLTGIGPDMAATLVSLGISLERVVTRGTLQDGIAYAQTRRRPRAA